MARARTNGLELEYDVLGKADAEPVLLIAGLGSQMTCWTAPFRALLVARGYRASDGFVAHGLNFARLIASPGHPFDAQARREQILADAERADDSAGFGRQLAAMATAGDIRPRLKGVSAPTLAVHGADDVLLPAAGGLDIVANVTGAGLRIIAGMGHDIPPELYEDIAAAIVENARRGTGKPGPDLHSRR
jgi:pimeloyl-ACP methyl ester carboxylesterase